MPIKQLKLYVWRMPHYHSGLAVAIAYNIPQARRLIGMAADARGERVAGWRLRQKPIIQSVENICAYVVGAHGP